MSNALIDEYGRRPRTYRSVVMRPDGITTTVTIQVPANIAATWKDVGELSEIAAMGAARTAGAVDASKTREDERSPF